jgi:enterochelin esterase-like enzyme
VAAPERQNDSVQSNGFVQPVTFRYRRQPGDGPVLVVGGFVQGGRSARELYPVEGTDMVERTWELPDEYLGTYLFWVGNEGADPPEDFDDLLPFLYSDAGRPIPDPDNPDRFAYPVDPEHPGAPFVQSIVRMPKSISEPLVGAPLLGRLTEHRIASSIMHDERRVWVHESVGITPDGESPALMVVFDGGVYAHLLHTPEQVDALVAAGEFPATVTLYCHFASDDARNEELQCRDDFAEFVVDELVAWARGQWRFTDDPARTIVAGSSLGGLGATWMAFTRSDRFGNVIAQSPSYWYHPQHPERSNWLAERWPAEGPPTVRCYVEMGDLEQQDDARHFVEVARAHGNDATFERFSGGHDFLAWRSTFPRALRWIGARIAG